MNKTKIEWCDYTVNPVKGICPVGCSYCYARRMYERYKWETRLTYHDEVFKNIPKKPSRIFIGSTIDLFHDNIIGVFPRIMEHVERNPKHTFIFLTKCPHNLPKEWPDNCWVGVSTIGNDCRSGLEDIFAPIKAKVKFVSVEPLLDYTPMDFRWVKWVIVGEQTPYNKKTAPRLEWVKDIVQSADALKVPVFLKNNLKPLFADNAYHNWAHVVDFKMERYPYILRHEYPL